MDQPTSFGIDRRRRAVRGRYLLLYLVVAIALSLGVMYMMPDTIDPWSPINFIVLGIVFYGFLCAMLLSAASNARLESAEFLTSVSATEVRWSAMIALALFILSVSAFYFVYVPLSYVFPLFVDMWVLNPPWELFWYEGDPYQLGNFLSLAIAVVFGPIVEEFLFRGLLLRVWIAKWGTWAAIIVSSAIFAALHLSFLGAFVYSVVVSLAYIWTGKFLVPVLIHMVHNAAAMAIEGGILIYEGPTRYSIVEFRAEWWVAVVGLAIGLPALAWLLRNRPPRAAGEFPTF